jgi:hypothetical protein
MRFFDVVSFPRKQESSVFPHLLRRDEVAAGGGGDAEFHGLSKAGFIVEETSDSLLRNLNSATAGIRRKRS